MTARSLLDLAAFAAALAAIVAIAVGTFAVSWVGPAACGVFAAVSGSRWLVRRRRAS